jgi:general secretion pathway protein I
MKLRTKGGFTLIEVVLAMGILVMGMSVLLSLLTFGAALTRSADLRIRATTVIEAIIGDLEESLFPLQDDGTVGDPPERIEARPVPGAVGAVYSATTRPNPDDFNEYVVEVQVSWEAEGVRRTKTFETLLLREVPFGERMRRRFVAQRPTDLERN